MAYHFKKLYLSILLIMFGVSYLKAGAGIYFSEDSLAHFVKIKDRSKQDKKILNYIKAHFQNNPENTFAQGKITVYQELDKYSVEDKEAFKYFIEGIIQNRYLKLNEAETAMVKAINVAAKTHADFLLYSFLSHLAFIQTDKGNAIGAIYSYGLAQKQAIKLNDPQLQVLLCINISDLYYKMNLYNQSLFYLNQGLSIKEQYNLREDRFYTIISYNKAENFFRMNQADSLQACHNKLMGPHNWSYKLYTYQYRTGYYLLLLKHQYKNVISQIRALQSNKQYIKADLDNQNLADAFYMNNEPDSAKRIIEELLTRPYAVNHPEVKHHLYETLGNIARDKGDDKLAAYNFALALKQSEERINNTTQVGDISAQIKIDKIESSFVNAAGKYKRERLILILIIIATVFMITVIALLYRSIKQKRHYEKLLYDTKREELAFINSHEVRKHLTNILGIIEILRQSVSREQEFIEAEKHLFSSATKLDEAIKNISEKLSEKLPD